MTTDKELRRRFKAAAHTMRRPEPSIRRTEEAAKLREPLDRAVSEAITDAAAKWEESHPMPALPRIPRWPGRRRRRVMSERHRLRMEYKFSADRRRFITDAEKAAREEFRTAYSQTHGADLEALIRGAQEGAKAATQAWSEWRRAREAAAEEMRTIVKTHAAVLAASTGSLSTWTGTCGRSGCTSASPPPVPVMGQELM